MERQLFARTPGDSRGSHCKDAIRPNTTSTAAIGNVQFHVVPRRSIAGDERLLWVGLSDRQVASEGLPGSHPAVRVRKRGAPCSCATARHSDLRRGALQGAARVTVPPSLGRKVWLESISEGF